MNKTDSNVMQLRVLGTPAVLVDGQPAAGLLKKSEGLLYLLAISGRSWARAELAEMLWDDGGPAGRQSLRVALTKLPKPWGEVLRRDGDRLELSADCDLHRWDERCTAVRAYLSDGSADKAEAALQAHCRALADWPGWLLDGFNIDAPQFDDWLFAQRQRVQRYWAETVIAAVERLAAAARWVEIEAVLQRLLQFDPAHETAHRWLIHCFVQTARPEAARGQFELCKRQLATLAGAAPSEATRAALQGVAVAPAIVRPAMAVAEAVASEPAPSHPNIPNNLPRQVNSFVGRGREMREVAELLRRHQLVTLVGTGGIGKTRLSQQVGEQLLEEFPDGVWLTDFTAVREGQQLAQQLAIALSVREEPGHPVIEAVEQFVRGRRLLIILDNCEHVVDGAAELAKRLVQAGDGVVVLATSRERLRVGGEAAYDLQTLDLPADAASMSLPELLDLDAVRLFTDRAAAARYDFHLNADNAADILNICRRLDAIPLAIELAAARVRTMSVSKIAENLDNRFRLPGAGDRTHLTRQQTLEALIDWSYRLLDEEEATLFRRLSIFAGGWTLEAAEDVASGGALEGLDITDLMVRLAEKSLVAYEADADRYRMLETVRHFARMRLEESGEADDLRKRHVHFYVALAETARPQLATSQQALWLARLDAERENLLAAFARSSRMEDSADYGARFVQALRPYWVTRGLMAEALEAVGDALGRPGMEAKDTRRCESLFAVGAICNFSGRWTEARVHLEECLQIAQDTSNFFIETAVLQQLGRSCFELQDYDAAKAHTEQGVALAERLGDPRQLAAASNSLGQCLRLIGDSTAAESLYERALAISRELGDQEFTAIALLNLAMISVHSRAGDKARNILLEVLQIAEATGSRQVGQSVIEVCAGLAATLEEWSVAARFYGAAEEQARITGLRRDAADDAFLAPLIEMSKLAFGPKEFSGAQAKGSQLDYPEALRAANTWLASGRQFTSIDAS